MNKPTNNLTIGQIWLGYHTRKATEIREQLDRTSDPIEQVQLQHELRGHVAAVNAIDKAAQAADRRAKV